MSVGQLDSDSRLAQRPMERHPVVIAARATTMIRRFSNMSDHEQAAESPPPWVDLFKRNSAWAAMTTGAQGQFKSKERCVLFTPVL